MPVYLLGDNFWLGPFWVILALSSLTSAVLAVYAQQWYRNHIYRRISAVVAIIAIGGSTNDNAGFATDYQAAYEHYLLVMSLLERSTELPQVSEQTKERRNKMMLALCVELQSGEPKVRVVD